MFSRRLYETTGAFERFYYDTMNGELKTTQTKWEGLTNTNIKMNTLANFIKTAMDDQNKYFTPSGFSEHELKDNFRIYATSNLGNKLKELVNEINILDLK